MRRVVAVVAVFQLLNFLALSASAVEPRCDAILTGEEQVRVVDQELARLRAEAGRVQRVVLRILDRRFKERIVKECSARVACTATDVKQAVDETVATFNQRSKRWRAYAIILGTWSAGLSVTVYLTTGASTRQYAPFIAFISGAALNWIIAPVLAPISSRVPTLVHRLTGRGAHPEIRKQGDAQMQEYYLRTQSTIGSLAQIGGQRLNQYLDSLDMKLAAAREALLRGDRALARDALAEIAQRSRVIFPEIRPDDPQVLTVAVTSRLADVPGATGLLEATLLRLEELNPKDAKDPFVRAYYERVLRSWLGIERHSS